MDNCDYPVELKDQMIRDRLVVGIKDLAQSEALQLDAELTLEKAKKKIRQKEAIKELRQQLKPAGPSNPETLDEMRYHRDQPRGNPRRQNNAYGRPKVPVKGHHKQTSPCTRCGREQHTRDKCPAKDAVCHSCNKKGHYSSKCYAKQRVEEVTADLDVAYLDTLTAGETTWKITLWSVESGVGLL